MTSLNFCFKLHIFSDLTQMMAQLTAHQCQEPEFISWQSTMILTIFNDFQNIN